MGWPERIPAVLQRAQITQIKLEAVTRDSTSLRVHPDGTGHAQKRSQAHQPLPRWQGRLNPSGSCGCVEQRSPAPSPQVRPAPRPQDASGCKSGVATRPARVAHGPAVQGIGTRRLAAVRGYTSIGLSLAVHAAPGLQDPEMYRQCPCTRSGKLSVTLLHTHHQGLVSAC